MLPRSRASARFSIVSLDEMACKLYRLRKSTQADRYWQFFIFNCYDVSQHGRHWLLLILLPSVTSTVILFDSLAQTYPVLMYAFRQLDLENIWINSRRIQAW
jgi:hypothetical protein